jgi:hypothetical protein
LICIKQATAKPGSRVGGVSIIAASAVFALLLGSSPAALSQNNADALNERIPVSNAELEAHWQVDCTATRDGLLALAQQPRQDTHCTDAQAFQGRLKLCVFIYQAPASNSRHQCPDYAGALKALEVAGQQGRCGESLAAITNMLECEP